MKTRAVLQGLLPVLVLAVGGLGVYLMIRFRKMVEPAAAVVIAPRVRVQAVRPTDVTVQVESQGTVVPRTETNLVAEVAGRTIAVSPSLASGGFFEKDAMLVTIEAIDYELAVQRAEAEVARAQRQLAWEQAEAEAAMREWRAMNQSGEPPALVARGPQLAEAKSMLAAAIANRDHAHKDLERTVVRAPYAGRVREKSVDLGQFVNRGSQLARIYAVDAAEVKLPVPDDELAHLDLRLDYRGEGKTDFGPTVELRARFAGKDHSWSGRIVRTEGEIDPRTRMVQLVARVENPYAREEQSDRPPLAAGMFVHARIAGRTYRDAVVIPRDALRERDVALVVDSDDRLRRRRVQILRTDRQSALLRSGLASGERVVVSPLEAVTEGMKVRIEESAAEAGNGAGNGK